jgi:GntP family gluconate:H+ symporter
MILPAVLLPLAVLLIVLLVERIRLPIFLAIMAAIVAYGVANSMTFYSVGKAFGLGFAHTLEQVGLLVIAGALAARLLARAPLGSAGAAVAGAIAGLGSSPAGALALLQPIATGAALRTVGLVLTLLATQALVAPSPLAVAAGSVLKVDFGGMALVAVPAALAGVAAGWLLATALLADSGQSGANQRDGDQGGGDSWRLIAVAIPVALLVVLAVAQMPTEPLGKGGAREFYMGIGGGLVLSVMAIALALAVTRSWPGPTLADTSWAPLFLAVGAAGGLARVLDEAGMADLIAEQMMRPGLGLLSPFLAAASVKTLQGNSLSAVLTASGMTEPMLGALGLDSTTGRALAAAAAGAGSIAVTHLNDPLFWIAAYMSGLSLRRALLAISLGSATVALAALGVLMLIRVFV